MRNDITGRNVSKESDIELFQNQYYSPNLSLKYGYLANKPFFSPIQFKEFANIFNPNKNIDDNLT